MMKYQEKKAEERKRKGEGESGIQKTKYGNEKAGGRQVLKLSNE